MPSTLSDRPLPAELGRVIGIQDHLDDGEGGDFHEMPLPGFYPAPQSSPRSVPHLHKEREQDREIDIEPESERDSERGRDYFACRELAVASPRDTLSVRGKQLSMHEEKSPSGLCCRYQCPQKPPPQSSSSPSPPMHPHPSPCLWGIYDLSPQQLPGMEGGEGKEEGGEGNGSDGIRKGWGFLLHSGEHDVSICPGILSIQLQHSEKN